MKRGLLVFFLLIICCTGLIFYSKSYKKNPKWDNPKAWKKLEKGMTTKQVEELLGKPGQIISRGGGTRWYYQDLPREIHKEPSYGHVFFRPKDWPKSWPNPNSINTTGELVVHEWAEPDSSSVKEAEERNP